MDLTTNSELRLAHFPDLKKLPSTLTSTSQVRQRTNYVTQHLLSPLVFVTETLQKVSHDTSRVDGTVFAAFFGVHCLDCSLVSR